MSDERIQTGLDRYQRWPRTWFRIQQYHMRVSKVGGEIQIEHAIVLRNAGRLMDL